MFIQLPTVYPLAVIRRTLLMTHEVDGSVHCAEVMCHVESMDGKTEQYLLTSEVEETDEEGLWIFKEVVGHRKNGQAWDVKMKWEDDLETWEPLAVIWK
eukprot:2392150-Ditylum_brightwellii.AAC.1